MVFVKVPIQPETLMLLMRLLPQTPLYLLNPTKEMKQAMLIKVFGILEYMTSIVNHVIYKKY